MAQPAIISNERINATRRRVKASDRMELQMKALQRRLELALHEIELLTAERDELVEALKDWARERA
jgi:hypothetical protein